MKKNIEQIMQMIPHRYPFLLIDKVLDIKPDESIVCLKNVTMNEPHFPGHFPKEPIMPGVLIVEALAQAAGVLAIETSDGGVHNEKVIYFMSISDAKFRKPVVPGDTLILKVNKIKHRGNVWKMRGEAFVDDQKVSEAEFSAMVTDA